ncbi:hypothetical protein [Arvimicrobium flavum]|uniref:hypothetical protein n=1 Tax=Arvimicrobium flavum TaxID=3393320 RepID=UPI00237C3A3B|nr:hypothetical protein [Mesorhizobium shangrilense]
MDIRRDHGGARRVGIGDSVNDLRVVIVAVRPRTEAVVFCSGSARPWFSPVRKKLT